MSDNYVEYSSKCDSLKPQEDEESKVANFKLLYRNTKNPERDKISGASSDDETTSSSLVQIPNTLKHMKNDFKKTVTDLTEHSETESLSTNLMEKPSEKVMQSLEKLRKKYTLLNENSVAWKMNSANSMLDDILNCTNFNLPASEVYKDVNFKSRIAGETETETSNNELLPCPINNCMHFPSSCTHTVSPLNFTSPCQMHNRVCQSSCDCCNSFEKGQLPPQGYFEDDHKDKSLGEKIQNFKGIRAVYHTFLKTKNSFNKIKSVKENRQDTPGPNCKSESVIKNELGTCKCEITNCVGTHYPKKMIFDLVESSENCNSDAKSTEREEMNCTCKNQKCICPEVIPKCICTEYTYQVAEQTSESPLKENPQMTNASEKFKTGDGKNMSDLGQKNEESILLIQKEKADGNKDGANSLRRTHPDWKKYCSKERKYIEKTDIYYFDHGNSAYYRTTDNHPLRYTECLVERTDEYATKFWAEIFGFIGIGIAFIISFVLQLYRFLFASIIRSLTVGLLQIFSDYFFKPLLTVLFNGILQPCLILAYNVATSFRDLCLPISQSFGFFAKEIANVFRACRIVEINHEKFPRCNCGNKI